eukprot:Protomagalhaensia_wolfi_Nauph_80__524@NODE_1297_length_1604_cov_722_185304_g1002_i0_p1_GENE_NODE_1297_length_1604_cov_722_185304_g1002_i0NODE_1297_length_1604_cov_722_185304_g1002_i0_p1_ORF_typecomplete_len428_score56_20Mid2/PF04478_12/0_0061Alpha_GJ/PF03229_13/4_6e03Alpha_GJ/PF03229_13/0_95_NODE_1297_length_1604_cov_722_185304_g1002_i0951378
MVKLLQHKNQGQEGLGRSLVAGGLALVIAAGNTDSLTTDSSHQFESDDCSDLEELFKVGHKTEACAHSLETHTSANEDSAEVVCDGVEGFPPTDTKTTTDLSVESDSQRWGPAMKLCAAACATVFHCSSLPTTDGHIVADTGAALYKMMATAYSLGGNINALARALPWETLLQRFQNPQSLLDKKWGTIFRGIYEYITSAPHTAITYVFDGQRNCTDSQNAYEPSSVEEKACANFFGTSNFLTNLFQMRSDRALTAVDKELYSHICNSDTITNIMHAVEDGMIWHTEADIEEQAFNLREVFDDIRYALRHAGLAVPDIDPTALAKWISNPKQPLPGLPLCVDPLASTYSQEARMNDFSDVVSAPETSQGSSLMRLDSITGLSESTSQWIALGVVIGIIPVIALPYLLYRCCTSGNGWCSKKNKKVRY